MKKILIIIGILFLGLLSLRAQVEIDSCNCETERILCTYKRLKPFYEKQAFNKLFFYLNKDDTLKNAFLSGDSTLLKQLNYKIIPVMKLNYIARNYIYPENMCKYFEFDTINFDCEVVFYTKNDFYFYIDKDWTDCYHSNPISLGPRDYNNDGRFCQNYYLGFASGGNSQEYRLLYKYDVDLLFYVDEIAYFYIKDSSLSRAIILYDYYFNIVDKKIKEEWIRYCAKKCGIGGTPWWRFWDWDLFLKKPSPSSQTPDFN
ncbi:MAG: hypothetical protein ABSG15_13710 [FCB group bacterium]|jgi:hypothetical protein